MVFTSFNFLIFLPAVALLYYLTPVRFRWVTLLIASYFFYINIKPLYALLTAGITMSTYTFTRLIEATPDDRKKRRYMVTNIILILLPLLLFKYFSAINNGLISLLESQHLRWPLPEMRLMLPVGISFYTFMAIGYTVDVYNEEIPAERNVGILALFVSFFPLVLSGPIERAKNMLPQFRAEKKIDFSEIVLGVKLMLWGYFMKLVVADRVGIYIDAVYDNIAQHNGTSLLIASLLHPFQLYGDLGGYTLLAMGTARVLGINVTNNFNRPFFATSMGEFWRRWHMSLITWLTDYIYTPLSFSIRRLRIWGIVIALLLTFLLSGIWHGATVTYIVWGLFQGLLLSIEALMNKKKSAFEKRHSLASKPLFIFISILITYILLSSSLVFVRAGSISETMMVFKRIFANPGTPYLDLTTLFYSLIGISLLMFKDFKDEFFPGRIRFFTSQSLWVRFSSYLAVLFLILLFGVFGGSHFIYFQF